MTRSLQEASSSSMTSTILSLAELLSWNFATSMASRIQSRQSIGRAHFGASRAKRNQCGHADKGRVQEGQRQRGQRYPRDLPAARRERRRQRRLSFLGYQ